MTKFRYRGYDENSVAQTGTLEAEDYAEAFAVLQYQGVKVVSLAPERVNLVKLFTEWRMRWALGERWVSVFFRELSVMLGVMTLHESLLTLTRAAEGHISEKILKEIVEVVETGETFSSALRRHEIIFGSDAIQSVEVGEASGRLQEVTARLASQLERNYATGRKVRGAMYYPLVVLIAAVVAAVVMINVTLPVFESFYSEQGGDLPLITLILLHGGRFLSAHWLLISALILAIIILTAAVYQRVEAVRFFCDGLKLRVKVLREIELRNLFSRLGFLLESGVTLDDALRLSAASSGNLQMGKMLAKIQASIEAGEKFGATLKRVLKDLSPLYLGLIVTGETSGNIVEMLRQCEAMADFEIEETLRALPAKAEVYGTLAAGAIVGALVFSIVLPILNMTNLF